MTGAPVLQHVSRIEKVFQNHSVGGPHVPHVQSKNSLGNRCSILLSYQDFLRVAVSIGGDWIERAVMIVLVLGHADFYGGGNRHDWESNAG